MLVGLVEEVKEEGCLKAAMPPARMIASTLKAGRDAGLGKPGCCLLLGLPLLLLLGLDRFCGLEVGADCLLIAGSAAFGSFFTKQRGSSCSGGEAGGMGR